MEQTIFWGKKHFFLITLFISLEVIELQNQTQSRISNSILTQISNFFHTIPKKKQNHVPHSYEQISQIISKNKL